MLFSVFKTAWKSLRFATIHYSITPDENVREFYETLYGAALGNFVMTIVAFTQIGFKAEEAKSETLAQKVEPTIFALYTVYSLYYTQPLTQRVKVNINLGK